MPIVPFDAVPPCEIPVLNVPNVAASLAVVMSIYSTALLADGELPPANNHLSPYIAVNARLKSATLVTVLTPSYTLNVNPNVPAFASLVLGVIVNTLSAWLIVAVSPSAPLVTLYVYVNPKLSGSVASTVITVGVPSVAKLNGVVPALASCTLLITGALFVSVALSHPVPLLIYNLLVLPPTQATSPFVNPVVGKFSGLSYVAVTLLAKLVVSHLTPSQVYVAPFITVVSPFVGLSGKFTAICYPFFYAAAALAACLPIDKVLKLDALPGVAIVTTSVT